MHAALLQQHAALANQANVISQQGSYKTRSDKLEVQQKPVNLIALGETKSDNIIRMITDDYYLVILSKWDI